MASRSQAAALAAAMPLAIIDGAFREVLASEGEGGADFVPKFLERAAAKFADIFSVPGALESVRQRGVQPAATINAPAGPLW